MELKYRYFALVHVAVLGDDTLVCRGVQLGKTNVYEWVRS